MAKKAKNYFKRVAEYQKAHPRATRAHAMKMVSKEISGTKRTVTKKKVGAVKSRKAAPKTKMVVVGSSKKRVSSSPIKKAAAHAKKIEELELVLKNVRGTAAKNNVKRRINVEHDHILNLQKHF